MKIWIHIVLIMTLLPCLSQAQVDGFQLKMTNAYAVDKVQIFKPRIKVGPDELVNLHFVEWLPIDEDEYPEDTELTDNIVGLTDQGQLYHAIQVGLDNYARLLSGKRCISEVQLLRGPQALIARDCNNQILVYSASKWIKNPALRIALHRGAESLVYGGLTAAFVVYAVNLTAADLSPAAQDQIENWMFGLSGFTLGMIQAAKGLFDFEALNKESDGLVSVGIKANRIADLTAKDLEQIVAKSQPSSKDWAIDCRSVLKYHIDRNLL